MNNKALSSPPSLSCERQKNSRSLLGFYKPGESDACTFDHSTLKSTHRSMPDLPSFARKASSRASTGRTNRSEVAEAQSDQPPLLHDSGKHAATRHSTELNLRDDNRCAVCSLCVCELFVCPSLFKRVLCKRPHSCSSAESALFETPPPPKMKLIQCTHVVLFFHRRFCPAMFCYVRMLLIFISRDARRRPCGVV